MAQEEIPDSTKQEECICEALCTEDSINDSCPVCGTEGADLSVCEGKETDEENTEVIKPEDVETEDANLCSHHKEHTEDCGYIPASENGEGSQKQGSFCAYECHICPIEELIAALPDKVTEDNESEVRAQIDEILALYRELTEEEQEQVDISQCLRLQEALDAANAPTSMEEPTEGAVAKVEKEGEVPTYTTSLADAFTSVQTGGTITLLTNVELTEGRIVLNAGYSGNITLNLNGYVINSSVNRPIWLGVDVNLTICGSGNIQTSVGSAVYMNAGTLTLAGGSFSSSASDRSGISVAEGILNVTSDSVTIDRLYVDSDTVSLTAGTYTGSPAIETGSSDMLSGLLDSGCAYYKDNQPLVLEGLTGTTVDGPVTVGVCEHPCVLSDNGDDTHGGDCPYCGTKFSAEPHTDTDGDGKCDGCKEQLATKVSIGGNTTYHTTIETAWDAAKSNIATVTLLDNVAISEALNVTEGDHITFDGGEYILTCDDDWADTFYVDGGTLTIIGGTITSAYVVEINSGTLAVTGGKIEASQLGIMVTGANATVHLSGGTITGGSHAVSTTNNSVKVSDFLLNYGGTSEPHYAYYQGSTPVTSGLDEKNLPAGTYTVKECNHDAEGVKQYQHNGGEQTHTLSCLACGYTETTECTYDENNAESNEDGTHTLTCSACGSTKTEKCSGGTASYTNKAVCEMCNHEYGDVLKDSGAPTGEISIRTSKWNSFLNTIMFGLFFRNTEKVTITAEDQESGVKSVSYYISDSRMSEEEVKALRAEWTDVDGDTVKFNISGDQSCVVYAKITDNQGNMTYISSDGMVFDGTAPSITGVENDKSYCEQQTVTATVRDENLESVTVNGKNTALPDGGKELSITLDVATGVKTIIIEAKDKAGNASKVTVYMGHHYGTEWKADKENHWHECTGCGLKSDLAAHSPDGGTVTKEPTKTETGIKTYKCTVCGYVIRTEAIPKLPQTSGSEDNNGSGNNGSGDNGQGNNNNNGENKNNIPETKPTNVITPAPAEITGVKPETDTAKPGTGTTKPGNGTTQDSTRQSSNTLEGSEPFIKDADDKIGWDVIRAEEEKTEDGNVINVDMNGSIVVPGDIFDRLKGRDITITFDMGNGIIWSVDGKSITTDEAGDIDFSVRTGVSTVPVDIVNNVTGEDYSIQISLSYEGEFGFTAVLSIGLGKENAGYTASLYYYNESTGELEFISSDTVAQDGTASLAFTHASDYVITVDAGREESSGITNTAEPEGNGGTADNVPPESPKTVQGRKNAVWPVVAGIIVLAGIVFAGVFVWKRKEEKDSGAEENK